jgi:hypothetical protein
MTLWTVSTFWHKPRFNPVPVLVLIFAGGPQPLRLFQIIVVTLHNDVSKYGYRIVSNDIIVG